MSAASLLNELESADFLRVYQKIADCCRSDGDNDNNEDIIGALEAIRSVDLSVEMVRHQLKQEAPDASE